jgi:miniconductance mechanosensitive channel
LNLYQQPSGTDLRTGILALAGTARTLETPE